MFHPIHKSTAMLFQKLFKDARYFQIIFQSIFLCYGIYFLSWSNEYWLYTTYFITCLATQFIAEFIYQKKPTPFFKRFANGIPSVLISAFGLSLLLKTNSMGVAIFAAVISIASKYFLRINGKHIFNPSALGIVTAILITGNAWISPGQWGSNAVILFGVLSLGFIITTKIQKLDVSLLIFSFFMITDPKTIPNHTVARILWAGVIAAIAFYLTAFRFVNGAPIFVLVFAQLFVPLLDKFFKAKKFEWNVQPTYTDKALNETYENKNQLIAAV